MALISDLKTTFATLNIPCETGVWSSKAPAEYVVLIPLDDEFDIFGDNLPEVTIQEVRISLYMQGNYTAEKDKIIKKLLAEGYTITYASYVDFELDTKYHHYNIDVAKYYEMEIE